MKRLNAIFAGATLIGALGCGELGDAVTVEEGAVAGDALPGVNATTYAAAKANFNLAEGNTDGLGPIMNERACGLCHQASGVPGGAGENIERRYGTLTNGVFNGLAATGGSLRQLEGIGGYSFVRNGQTINCQSGTDANPAPGATIFAGRVTTPTTGAGLVELIPDQTIINIAAAQPAAIRGIVNFDTVHLTDGPFTRGSRRVARFGWKNVHASVTDFAADAYLNEMGITTSSCAGGARVDDFATENRANRAGTNAVINNCADDGKPGIDDDQAADDNNCAGGLTDVQDDVSNFAFFMRNSAAPPRHADNSNGGAAEFNREGCNGCHLTTTFTVTINGRSVSFQPFSDFLVHDMGSLGDLIGNDGDSVAVTRRMRTAPLWGISNRNHLLHDGRTSDRAAAVRAHDGQGAAARNAFNAATGAQQNSIVLFLQSL
jgi:CxxC motif-containing protein (DUF1111 family)